MTLDHSFFKLAKSISHKAEGRVSIGAVLTKNRKIVSVGFNQMSKTHPKMFRIDKLKKLHAELSAIIGIYKTDLTGSVMFLYRERKDGLIGNCRPCEACQIILREAGIKKVYYSDPAALNQVGEMKI